MLASQPAAVGICHEGSTSLAGPAGASFCCHSVECYGFMGVPGTCLCVFVAVCVTLTVLMSHPRPPALRQHLVRTSLHPSCLPPRQRPQRAVYTLGPAPGALGGHCSVCLLPGLTGLACGAFPGPAWATRRCHSAGSVLTHQGRWGSVRDAGLRHFPTEGPESGATCHPRLRLVTRPPYPLCVHVIVTLNSIH